MKQHTESQNLPRQIIEIYFNKDGDKECSFSEVDKDGKPILDLDGNQLVTLGLKSIAITRTKETARTRLSKTDWYVTRKTEAGTAIPSTVTDYRTAVRNKCKTIEDAITACDTLAKFMALYDVPVDSNGDPTGNAPIHDWPEEI